MKNNSTSGLLDSYRILDLTDERGLMCGKLLGDLGADVLKVEKPRGDDARRKGPFYRDKPDPEKSMSWFALNASKRGITLDIESEEGKKIFRQLVKSADCIIESFFRGYLDNLGLGYNDLVKINPEIILTSITPFGATGPYKDYKASDLTLWALSGLLFICGDPDRPPIRISLPQSYLHASTDAATGTAMALYHRGLTHRGQQVHVSIFKSMERVAYMAHTVWDARRKIQRRPGGGLKIPPRGTVTPLIWQCKDGYVAFYLFGGQMGAVSNPALSAWMEEEGVATDTMINMNWLKFDIGNTPQQEIDREIVIPISTFFKKHTQSELWDGGVKRRVMVYPVNNASGVLKDKQLKEREFWIEIEHPELNDTITYPGAFIKTEEELCRIRNRAPLIGEHNDEIYGRELGFSKRELSELKEKNVI